MPTWRDLINESVVETFKRQWQTSGPNFEALLKVLNTDPSIRIHASCFALLGELLPRPGVPRPREDVLGYLVGIKPGLVILRGDNLRMTGLLERDGESSVRAYMFDPYASFYIWPTQREGREPQGMFKAFADAGFDTCMTLNFNRDEDYAYGIPRERWAVMLPWLDQYLPFEKK